MSLSAQVLPLAQVSPPVSVWDQERSHLPYKFRYPQESDNYPCRSSVPKVTLKTASEEDSKEVTPTPETEDKSEGETRENLIYDSEDNSKVEKTSDQKK